MSANLTPRCMPTTPASSPLNTLKALVLRNVDALEYVQDQLAGSSVADSLPDGLLEDLDALRQAQYRALAEHLPVGRDELLGELRVLPREAYLYDDCSPVVERLTSPPGITSTYYPRYSGDRTEFVAQHRHAVEQIIDRMVADGTPALVTSLDEWRSNTEDGGAA